MATKMVENNKLSEAQFEVLYSLANFLTINEISKYRKTSRASIYKILKILQRKGYLNKIGRASFEVTNNGLEKLHSLIELSNKIRLHNFAIKVGILESPKNWELKRNQITTISLFNKQINLKNNKYELFSLKNIKIKTTSKSVIFYLPTTYGKSVESATKQAMDMFFEAIPKVENLFKIRLTKNKKLNILIISQHYARIQDSLAKIYKKEGNKLYITGDDGKIWLIADYSFSTSELEAIHTIKAPDDMDTVHKFFNDLRKNPITPSQILEISHLQVQQQTKTIQNINNLMGSLTKLTQAQVESNRQLLLYKQQNKEHLKLIKLYVKEAEVRIKKNTKLINDKQKLLGDYL